MTKRITTLFVGAATAALMWAVVATVADASSVLEQ